MNLYNTIRNTMLTLFCILYKGDGEHPTLNKVQRSLLSVFPEKGV